MTPSPRGLLRLAVFSVVAHLAIATASAPASAARGAHADAAPGRIRPLARLKGLLAPRKEQVLRLANARVVLADYPLLRHDFKAALEARFGKPIDHISDAEADQWLLDATAYVSTGQAAQSVVNTPIATMGGSIDAYRPRDYGRALVFKPAAGALIDVKGSGAKRPQQTDHANGLASLGESIREYAYEHVVHRVFLHSNSGLRTVGHYAVIDAGFEIKFADGRQDRAGLILRQAHVRAPGEVSIFTIAGATKVERVLRRYGLTSAGAYQEDPFDRLNIQGTRDGALLDFGGFLAVPWFSKPAYHFDHTPDLEPNRRPIFAPQADFVQPDEAHRVPFHLWGFTESGRPDPVADNPWLWGHRLARALADGGADRRDAERHLHDLLDPVDAQLRN